MAKETVPLTLDATLIARAERQGELSAVVEAALRLHLDQGGRQAWAEENALLLEALAGGAEKAK